MKLLVPCGTTGESATMTEKEDQHVIKRTIELARDRARVEDERVDPVPEISQTADDFGEVRALTGGQEAGHVL